MSMFPKINELPLTYTLCLTILLTSVAGFYFKKVRQVLLLHPFEVFAKKKYYTLFTSAFIHRGWVHLLVNIYIFYGAARDVEYIILEERFPYKMIVLIYALLLLVSIILPNLIISAVKKTELAYTTLGFSGAVFGFLGFSLLYLPLDHPEKPYKVLPFLYYSYEFTWVLLLILILMPIVFKKSKTNHWVHILGFMIGLLVAMVIRPELVKELWRHFYN